MLRDPAHVKIIGMDADNDEGKGRTRVAFANFLVNICCNITGRGQGRSQDLIQSQAARSGPRFPEHAGSDGNRWDASIGRQSQDNLLARNCISSCRHRELTTSFSSAMA